MTGCKERDKTDCFVDGEEISEWRISPGKGASISSVCLRKERSREKGRKGRRDKEGGREVERYKWREGGGREEQIERREIEKDK